MKKYILTCWCALLPLLMAAQAKVIISELLYDTPLSESSGPNRYNGEFVSIYNYGREAVNVSGWSLVSDGSGQTFVFPEGSVMQPRAKFYVAYRNMNGNFFLSNLYSEFKLGKNDREFYQRAIVHTNTGENLKLYLPNGAMQDNLFYDGTSNKKKEPRLEALNKDATTGNQCYSLQRCNVTLEEGAIVFNPSDYATLPVAQAKYPTSVLSENGAPVVFGKLSYAYDESGNRTGRTIVFPSAATTLSNTMLAGIKAVGTTMNNTAENATEEQEQNSRSYYTDRLGKSNVVIYPNPTKGVLAVELRHANLEESYQLVVYSLSGTLVFQQTGIGNYTTIDLTSQPKGIYIMRILSSTSRIDWKILKE